MRRKKDIHEAFTETRGQEKSVKRDEEDVKRETSNGPALPFPLPFLLFLLPPSLSRLPPFPLRLPLLSSVKLLPCELVEFVGTGGFRKIFFPVSIGQR